MKKNFKLHFCKKLFISFILFVFLFSVVNIGRALASVDAISIIGARIVSRSTTVDVENFTYENSKVNSNITFHKVGDNLTYEIIIKNNEDVNYTVKSIEDNNTNEYVSYEYEDYSGTKFNSKDELTLNLTVKYSKEVFNMSERFVNDIVNIILELEEENGETHEEEIIIDPSNDNSEPIEENGGVIEENTEPIEENGSVIEKVEESSNIITAKKNPTTADYLDIYIISAVGSLLVLVFISKYKRKNNTKKIRYHGFKAFGLFVAVLLISTSAKAVSSKLYIVNLVNNISLKDKLLITYVMGDNTRKVAIGYNQTAEEMVPNQIDGYIFLRWEDEDGNEFDFDKSIEDDTKIIAKYDQQKNVKYTVVHKIMGFDEYTYTTQETEELEALSYTTIQPNTKSYTGFTAPEKRDLYIKPDGTSSIEYLYTRNKYLFTMEDRDRIQTSAENGEYYYGTQLYLKAKDVEGYTFKKWSNNQATKSIAIKISGPTTIKPIYELNSYTISFNTNGGTNVDNITRNHFEPIGTLPVTTKENKALLGWYTDQTYSEQIDENTIVTSDKTYYANWRDLNEYTLTFDPNGGEVSTTSKIVKESKAVGELPVPTLTDYIFEGWYTDTSYTTKIDENTVVDCDTDCVAKWRYRFITVYSLENAVTFNGGGEITGENLPEELYSQTYINTGVELFNDDNFEKDFIIEFEIVSYIPSNNVEQGTFINAKLENESLGYPGFVMRRHNLTNNIELGARAGSIWPIKRWSYTNVQKVKLYRIKEGDNLNMYYSINNGAKVQFFNFYNITSTFETPVTFGATLDASNNPMRYLTGTIKNISIKLAE